jgi:hypothetical protein
MGQNLDEALSNPDWRCPVCLDICNCSGVNCQRARRDLAPTQQLNSEAQHHGWDSVAHYLIMTELVKGTAQAVWEGEIGKRRAAACVCATLLCADDALRRSCRLDRMQKGAAVIAAPLRAAAATKRRKEKLDALRTAALVLRRHAPAEQPEDQPADNSDTEEEEEDDEDGHAAPNTLGDFVIDDRRGLVRKTESSLVRNYGPAMVARCAKADRAKHIRISPAEVVAGAFAKRAAGLGGLPRGSGNDDDDEMDDAGTQGKPSGGAVQRATARTAGARVQQHNSIRPEAGTRRTVDAADDEVLQDTTAHVRSDLLTDATPAADARAPLRLHATADAEPLGHTPAVFSGGATGSARPAQRGRMSHAGGVGAHEGKERSRAGGGACGRPSGRPRSSISGDEHSGSDSADDHDAQQAPKRRRAHAGGAGARTDGLPAPAPAVAGGAGTAQQGAHQAVTSADDAMDATAAHAAPGPRAVTARTQHNNPAAHANDDVAAEEQRPTAFTALLASARDLPWSTYTDARRLQEAARLLSRLSRLPAEVLEEDAEELAYAPAATAVPDSGPLPLRTCDDVRDAVTLLVLLAEHLPKAHAGRQIVPRLARDGCAGALVDCKASSYMARAHVIGGKFRLLLVLAERRCAVADVEAVATGIMDCVAGLATEYEELQTLRRNLGSQRAAQVIGALRLPAATDAASVANRKERVDSSLEECKWLLRVTLENATQMAALRSDAPVSGIAALWRMSLLSRLLDPRGCFDSDLRRAIFKLVRTAAAPTRRARQPEELTLDLEDAEFNARQLAWTHWNTAETARLAMERAAAAELCADVLPCLLTLLEATHPARARAPAAGVSPVAVQMSGGDEKLLLCALGGVLAAGLRSGVLTPAVVEAHVLAPHAPAVFWRRVGPVPRALAARLLAVVLKEAPECLSKPAEAGMLMRAWLITVADHEDSFSPTARDAAVQLTASLKLCALTAPLFANVTLEDPHKEGTRMWKIRRADAVVKVAAACGSVDLAAPLRASLPLWAGALTDAVEAR